MKKFSLLNEDASNGLYNDYFIEDTDIDGSDDGPNKEGNNHSSSTDLSEEIRKADNEKNKIIDSSKIESIKDDILHSIKQFNASRTSDSSVKKFFKAVELKGPNQVDIAKKFNNLQTTITTIEIYNKNTNVQNIKNRGDDQTSNVAYSEIKDGKITFKPSGGDEEQTRKEKEIYDRQLRNVQRVQDMNKKLEWANKDRDTTEALNNGFKVIRELMDNFRLLSTMMIFTTNFWKNYNNHINLIVSAIKLSNAFESQAASRKNIEDNMFDSKKQSKMGDGKMIDAPYEPINNYNRK